MYEHRISEFGTYTMHELINEDKGNRIALLPDYSACILSIQLGGTEVMDAYQTPIEVDLNRWFKNLPLFPFPNRMNEGQYQWEGNRYQFAINDVQTGTALHGFSANKVMSVEEVTAGNKEASIRCRYSFEGKHPGYPFPFSFDIHFHLNDDDGVTINLSATNEGDKNMPFGLGWHPYFQLKTPADHLKMQLPPLQMVGVDEHMIPTGKQYEYDRFTTSAKIGAEILDNCFRLRQEEGRATLTVTNDQHTLTYWQECAPDKYPFIQIFTPPHRNSIAIEPMSCNIDAFNNEDGLWLLQAGERKSAKFGFSLK